MVVGQKAQVEINVIGESVRQTCSVGRIGAPGQPSEFFLKVLCEWIKSHKFPWPGREVQLDDSIRLVVSQPARTRATISCERWNTKFMCEDLSARSLVALGHGCHLRFLDSRQEEFPSGYSPFILPISMTLRYPVDILDQIDARTVGVVKFEPHHGRVAADELYILKKNPGEITFCAPAPGMYALIAKLR